MFEKQDIILFFFHWSFSEFITMFALSYSENHVDQWWKKFNSFLKKKKEKKESLFIKHAEEEFYEGITAKLCRSAPSPWRDTPALPQVEGLPTYILQEIHFQGLVCKMTYNAMTETKTFANPLYFQLLRQYFWELKLPLAAKPEPTIEQPEGHSDGVHDHLSLSALFVFLF